MEKKNNGLLIAIIILLVLGLIGLGSYIVYDKVINVKDSEKFIKETKVPVEKEEEIKTDYSYFNNRVIEKNNLGITLTAAFNNNNEIISKKTLQINSEKELILNSTTSKKISVIDSKIKSIGRFGGCSYGTSKILILTESGELYYLINDEVNEYGYSTIGELESYINNNIVKIFSEYKITNFTTLYDEIKSCGVGGFYVLLDNKEIRKVDLDQKKISERIDTENISENNKNEVGSYNKIFWED